MLIKKKEKLLGKVVMAKNIDKGAVVKSPERSEQLVLKRTSKSKVRKRIKSLKKKQSLKSKLTNKKR